MKRPFLLLAVTVVAACATATACRADAIYTFEAPEFTNGQTTPILNAPPNSGPATFLTSFTDTSTTNGYSISTSLMNNLMMGQALLEPSATSPLTLTFNTPVTSLSVDFAVDTPQSPAGSLVLNTPVGSTTQTGSNVGGAFPGGHLTFSSVTPFTTATLEGFNAAGAPTQIEIDNLDLVPVPTSGATPEPASVVLLGFGAAGLFGYRWRRRRLAA